MIAPGASQESLAVERALIGGCLTDTRGSVVWPTVTPGHFFLDRHQRIWQAMLDTTERSDHPDVLMLSLELGRAGLLEEIGGAAYLSQCLEDGLHAVDLGRYGAIVRRAHAERLRVFLAAEVMAHPDGSERLTELLTELEADPTSTGRPAHLLLDELRPNATPFYPTGLPALDEQIGGVPAGQLVIVGGRTSHGKTAFVLNIAARLSRAGTAVELLTLEDPPSAIAARLAAEVGGVSVWEIRRQGVQRPLGAFDDLSLLTVTDVGSAEDAVVGAVAASRAEVVIVDHLQQIITHDSSRNVGLERIVGRLATVARRQAKAVLATSQLNRQIETRKGEPTLSDLRDSGAIEQAARQVWLLYWPSRHDAKEDPAEYRVIVAKNAEGPTRTVRLRWSSRTGRFWDPREPPTSDVDDAF